MVLLVILVIVLSIFIWVLFDKELGDKKLDSNLDDVPAPKPPIRRYFKKDDFLTLSEKKFFNVLKQITEDKFLIFPQVNLASLVDVNANRWETYKYRNPINRKTVDFCIFKKQILEPLLVIELDDFTHLRSDRMDRDKNVDKVLSQANIPILHVKTKDSDNIELLTKQIFEKISIH